MKRTTLCAAVVTASLVACAPRAYEHQPRAAPAIVWRAEDSAAAQREAISGDYRLLGGRSEAALAIESACARSGLLACLFARPLLRERVQIFRRVSLDLRSGVLCFAFDDFGPVSVPLDAAPHQVGASYGSPVYVTQSLSRGRIEQTLDNDGLRRSHTIDLAPDGTLDVHTRVDARSLSVPIEFRVRYRRVG